MRPLLDFDDAGAQDDRPAEGVTVGDIRAWFDQMESMRLALAPFARAANFYAIQNMNDDQIVLVKPSDAGLSGALVAADFRRASEIIEAKRRS